MILLNKTDKGSIITNDNLLFKLNEFYEWRGGPLTLKIIQSSYYGDSDLYTTITLSTRENLLSSPDPVLSLGSTLKNTSSSFIDALEVV